MCKPSIQIWDADNGVNPIEWIVFDAIPFITPREVYDHLLAEGKAKTWHDAAIAAGKAVQSLEPRTSKRGKSL